jgi:hypothetical protein
MKYLLSIQHKRVWIICYIDGRNFDHDEYQVVKDNEALVLLVPPHIALKCA